VHDLAFLRWPNLLTPEAARYYGQIHRAVRQARAIIAVSQATRNDLLELTAADPQRIEVIYEAPHPLFRPLTAIELQDLEATLRSQGKLTRVPVTDVQVVLSVATLEPRKNLPALIRAFSLVRPQANSPQLWIAGGRGWLDSEILESIRTSPAAPRVTVLGEVSQEELLWLYNRATLVALPSLYEGFGLPAVEAMACGRPLLASNVPALAEVVASGGLLLPPDDLTAWSHAIQTVLDSDAARTELSVRALARSKAFSWQKAAQQTLRLYRRVLQL
jgi:glycosyltransferase involved in cell wall biosynthesis